MDAGNYDETLRLLQAEALPVRQSRPYDGWAFGSWWIELATVPAVRLLWDGKEGWAVVQTATARRQPPWDEDKWEDRWVGRESTDQTPSQIVRHALEFARAAESKVE